MSKNIILKLQDFQRVGNGGIHQELALYLRRKIAEGILTPGEQLPSLRELSKLWEINIFSVQLATDDLVGRGLLNKQHGRGMYIASPAQEIRRIGIFTSPHFRLQRNLLAFSYMRQALTVKLRKMNVDYCYLEDREALHDAVIANRIQAVVGLIVADPDKLFFERLPIQKAVIMRDVMLDFSAVAATLAAHRCRRISAIVPEATPGGDMPVSFLVNGLKGAGVKIMARNIRVVPQQISAECGWDKIGYEHAKSLLTAPLRPDALIVYPDNAVPGVIQAILQLGIRVPDELCAVFHRNVELPYFCALDACFLDTRLDGIIDRLIESVTHINNKKTEA